MKRLVVLLPLVLLFSGVVLAVFSPDFLTAVDVALECLVVLMGIVISLIPLNTFIFGFIKGQESVKKASEVQTEAVWVAAFRMDSFFGNKTLDRIFKEYREKVQKQWESGQILSGIEEYINDGVIDSCAWHGLSAQIPGTLTGLGILGTFVGLLWGLRSIDFGTVQETISSVEGILQGINVAFYTSIAGVILSIIYNISHNLTYNIVRREMDVFLDSFHKYVIPTVEEQSRYRASKESRQMLNLMESLRRNTGASASHAAERGGGGAGKSAGTEQILMPQIVSGLKKGEFVFFLQPRYDLNTRAIVGGDALVRWKHSTLGVLEPAVFIPLLEQNGYITKLDQYIWESVCKTIRAWIDSGKRPGSISLNVTKTDILAVDLPDFFQKMIEKYRIPPRCIDVTISRKAYMEAGDVVMDVERRLLQAGIRVIIDGFDGDFVALNSIGKFSADTLELDLRRFGSENRFENLSKVFEKARQLHLTVFAVGIENAEQLTALRKCGCTEGQGFYFSKPLSVEDFEKEMEKGRTPENAHGRK